MTMTTTMPTMAMAISILLHPGLPWYKHCDDCVLGRVRLLRAIVIFSDIFNFIAWIPKSKHNSQPTEFLLSISDASRYSPN